MDKLAETVEGYVDKIVFRNENGYTVLSLLLMKLAYMCWLFRYN